MLPQKTDQIPADSAARAEFSAPRMIQIPAGRFLMGSDAGQDNERPVHRVWLDAFELGACQVANAEYAQFLSAMQHRKPLHWNDPNFSDAQQPVVAPSWFDAVSLLRMAQQYDAASLPLAYGSGMGICRARWPRTETISLG